MKVSSILGRVSISEWAYIKKNEELESKFKKHLYEIDRLPLKSLDKICIVNTNVYSKLKWEFSIYKLSTTLVEQYLDNILTCRIGH